MRELAEVWYTQWNENCMVESGLIQWEDFKEDFLGKYFWHDRRQVKFEEFINLKQGNMIIDEYS